MLKTNKQKKEQNTDKPAHLNGGVSLSTTHWAKGKKEIFFPLGTDFMFTRPLQSPAMSEPWIYPTAPPRWALHMLHLQGYLMQSNKVSCSLSCHKTHSVLHPDYQHSCAKGDDECCNMDASGAPTAIEQPQFSIIRWSSSFQIKVTTSRCKNLFCYCQSGSQHTSKANLVVSKYSLLHQSLLNSCALQNAES